MLVNACYFSRGMGVRNVFNSKCDLQGTSLKGIGNRDIRKAIYDFLVLYCNYFSLSCTVFEILSLLSHNLKRSRDSEHIPSLVVYHACTSTHLCQSAHDI